MTSPSNVSSNRDFIQGLIIERQQAVQQYETQASDIPIFSQTSIMIFKQLDKTSDSLSYPLADKVKTLKNTAKKLQKAKDHETRNKMIGVLKSALHIACIALVIIGGPLMATSEVGILMAVSGYLGAFSLGNLFSYEIWESPDYAVGLTSFMVGWTFPIISSFNKVSWLKEEQKGLEGEVASHSSKLKVFFEKNKESLRNSLQLSIKEMEDGLVALKNKPACDSSALKTQLSQFQTAMKELENGINFFAPQET